MQRNALFAAILILALLVIGLTMFMRGESAPPPAPGPVVEQPAAAPAENLQSQTTTAVADSNAHAREIVAVGPGPLADDPEIRASLCGFKGRVVDAHKQVVPECGVRMYRGGVDSVLPANFDLMAEQYDFEPQFIAGEVKTASDGSWLLTGVWPHAFYMLLAGIGTDAPTHQMVTRTPSPGEVIDLGDIVLADAGVITGTVVDDNGDGLAGALVRAADLPGTLAAFYPVERFDPEGALLIREPHSPVTVLEMPKWVKRVFDSLPIPSTTSDSAGNFRLVGVMPGSNLLATTRRGFLSEVRPSIQVRAGQEKNVGKLKLKRGEELLGKVVDSKGEPVPAAEVLAGSTLTVGPVDFAQRLDPADAQGHFHGEGFVSGKVTVAARRDKQHPWVLAESQPILNEVVVVLPATFAVTVQVSAADGSPIKQPRLKLLQGQTDRGVGEMALLGFVPPIRLEDRLKAVGEGQWRIESLPPGAYTLLADAPGHALAFTSFTITDSDAKVELQLGEPNVFPVLVVDTQNQPIRNATIYAESTERQVVHMPVMAGRTDGTGRFRIENLPGKLLRVSADHPKWGVVHGEAKLGEELVLVMQPPGKLVVTVVENGKPPEPGKFTVGVIPREVGGGRGAIETVPTLHTPGLDGSFTVAALQPGSYQLNSVKSLDALHSPGGVFGMMQEMYLMRDSASESCEVTSGQATEVVLQVGDKPIEGPTARLSGSVMNEGRPAVDYIVAAQGSGGRFTTKVDARGRFDLGTVSAGDLHLSVMGSEGGLLLGRGSELWAQSVKLTEGEVKDLTIDIVTTTVAGNCYLPDGSPAANVDINAYGLMPGSNRGNNVWRNTTSDANGAFRFTQMPPGTWQLNAQTRGEVRAKGQLAGVEIAGNSPVEGLRLEMRKSLVVKGRIDLTTLGNKKPQWMWLGFNRVTEGAAGSDERWGGGASVDRANSTFESDDLQAGRYRPTLYVSYEDDDQSQFKCSEIDVPPGGADNLIIIPGEKVK